MRKRETRQVYLNPAIKKISMFRYFLARVSEIFLMGAKCRSNGFVNLSSFRVQQKEVTLQSFHILQRTESIFLSLFARERERERHNTHIQ